MGNCCGKDGDAANPSATSNSSQQQKQEDSKAPLPEPSGPTHEMPKMFCSLQSAFFEPVTSEMTQPAPGLNCVHLKPINKKLFDGADARLTVADLSSFPDMALKEFAALTKATLIATIARAVSASPNVVNDNVAIKERGPFEVLLQLSVRIFSSTQFSTVAMFALHPSLPLAFTLQMVCRSTPSSQQQRALAVLARGITLVRELDKKQQDAIPVGGSLDGVTHRFTSRRIGVSFSVPKPISSVTRRFTVQEFFLAGEPCVVYAPEITMSRNNLVAPDDERKIGVIVKIPPPCAIKDRSAVEAILTKRAAAENVLAVSDDAVRWEKFGKVDCAVIELKPSMAVTILHVAVLHVAAVAFLRVEVKQGHGDGRAFLDSFVNDLDVLE